MHFKKTHQSKLYSKHGLLICDDDLLYLKNNETIYYDYKGRNFDASQIIDQY